MNNLFFTSDHHFGHNNIIKYCNRPFENVDEMNAALIKRWNEKIPPDGDVYHLGDFALCHPEKLEEILDQLNGRIHLIIGNHDAAALNYKKSFV
jgi:calcineurin-like phosphoesterase family protein